MMNRYVHLILNVKYERFLPILLALCIWIDLGKFTLILILYWQAIYVYHFVDLKASWFKFSTIIKWAYLWILLIFLIGVYYHFSLKIESHEIFEILIIVGIIFTVINLYRKIISQPDLVRVLFVMIFSAVIVFFF